ncbi:integrase core domain-containing protein [Streptomyces sp. NPDC059349]|uniref:integrase core domain-containing protein n=1 Tax=Streptomyces sp. NPDC059349 TaxID=3346808 RepID=UPI00369FEE13
MEILKTGPRSPRTNAHCERGIVNLRREVLDHVLVLNESHAQRVLAAYQQHYKHRPHQARDQLPPDAHNHPAAMHEGTVKRTALSHIRW